MTRYAGETRFTARFRAAVTVAVAAVGLAQPVPVHAVGNPSVAVVDVSGTVYPGLDTLPRAQSQDLSGTVTFVAADGDAHIEQCRFLGTGLADSKTEGFGTFSAYCGSFTLWTCAFVRTGLSMLVMCLDATAGPFVATWSGTLTMVPLHAPLSDTAPWTEVAWIGELTYASSSTDVAISRAAAGALTGSGGVYPSRTAVPRSWAFDGVMTGPGTGGMDAMGCSFSGEQTATSALMSVSCSGVSGYFDAEDCPFTVVQAVIRVQCGGATNLAAAIALTFSSDNTFTSAGAGAVTASS